MLAINPNISAVPCYRHNKVILTCVSSLAHGLFYCLAQCSRSRSGASWWPEPEQQMKTFCSSVCVNNRYPGNAGSYRTAQRHKHAAQMEKFPAASGVYLVSRSGGRGGSSRWWASAGPHQLLIMASLPSFTKAPFMKLLNHRIIDQTK